MKNILINGFGRIGRTFLRIVMLDKDVQKKIRVVAINLGPSDCVNLANLFTYDSVMGIFPGSVEYKNHVLTVNGQAIQVLAEADPLKLPYNALSVDWVVEASGCFTSREKAGLHVRAGAKKVLITAPSDDADISIIPGVNDQQYNEANHVVVSLGSCTTNAFAPLVKIVKENFGIEYGMMTTTHAYTNDQVLLDVEHKDPRRARAAALNIIPTKTGADKVIITLFPELDGKLKAAAIRVPVPVGSLIDFTFLTGKSVTKDEINRVLQQAALGTMKNIVQYCEDPLVSSDFIGNTFSCVVDSLLTQSLGSMGKIFAWYDNEYGYSSRIKDFLSAH